MKVWYCEKCGYWRKTEKPQLPWLGHRHQLRPLVIGASVSNQDTRGEA